MKYFSKSFFWFRLPFTNIGILRGYRKSIHVNCAYKGDLFTKISVYIQFNLKFPVAIVNNHNKISSGLLILSFFKLILNKFVFIPWFVCIFTPFWKRRANHVTWVVFPPITGLTVHSTGRIWLPNLLFQYKQEMRGIMVIACP